VVQASEDEAIELEKFQVTGSNIKRTDFAGPSPLVVLDQTAIEQSGATTISELFRDVIYSSQGVIDESFTQGFAPASAGIDLRGLGVNRTLVLVNGRRLPLFPFGQDGTASFVDINLIPVGAIERVEILKDGASAIYGADAVAGVVNFITKKDFEGVEVSAEYGQTGEGDGENTKLNLTGGTSNERGNITFTLDYLNRGAIMARDRDISASANGAIDDRSSLGNPGSVILLGSGGIIPDPRCPADSIDGPFCVFDFAPYVTLVPEVKRLGLTLNGEYALSDTVNLFANASLTNSDSERDLAPTGNAFFVSPANPINPFGEPVLSIYRLLELGPRRDEFETDAYNLVVGLNGFIDQWDWEVGAGTGKIDSTITGVNGYPIYDEVQAAIDSGVLNPFGTSPDFDPDSVTHITRREGESKQWFVDAKASAEIMEMTHGPLLLALGTEYRSEEFSDKMDELTASGEVLGIGSWDGEGDRDVFAAYAEFSIPLLEDLEMQLAGRYDDYNDFGSTFNPKLGLRWQPRDNLVLRLSAGTGFKAPSLQELYAGVGPAPVNESVFDPVTGDVVEVDYFESGNPDLEAEESESYSLGLVWDITPAWDASVDYWSIENENAVNSSPQFYVDNEDLFPDNVVRDPDTNEIISIESPFQNVAAQELWGIDLATGVNWELDGAGAMRFDVAAAYLGSFKEEPVTGAGFDQLAGKDGRPRWRGRTSLWWNNRPFDGGLILNYVGDYEREAAEYKVDDWTTVDAQFGWSPSAIEGGKFTLGIKNLFDENVPEDPYFEGWPFHNRALHDATGRFFYGRYQHKF
jgi:outer membrane receptor protein involved in Fe transport